MSFLTNNPTNWITWPLREHWNTGENSIVNEPLESWEKIIFPSELIIAGHMKQIITALDTKNDLFQIHMRIIPFLEFEEGSS